MCNMILKPLSSRASIDATISSLEKPAEVREARAVVGETGWERSGRRACVTWVMR